MFVTTPISEDGTFYAQLTSAEEPLFVEMVDRLQKFCTEQYPTPVFFNRGDLCAAQFSEDECWYRAHVEDIIKNQVGIDIGFKGCGQEWCMLFGVQRVWSRMVCAIWGSKGVVKMVCAIWGSKGLAFRHVNVF